MKRMLLYILVIAMLLSTTAFAATPAQTNTADALNELGLFLGTGKGYELDNNLTRAQGITLLVRMIGKEQEATANTYPMRFTDVPDWAAGYVGYALANGITNGVSETKFDPDGIMTDYMFLTLVLRALGYSDSGETPQFVWNKPYALAQGLGLVEYAAADENFTRGDAVAAFWNALDAEQNEGEETLAQQLVQQGIFTETQLETARHIQNGEKETVAPSYPSGNNKPSDGDGSINDGNDSGNNSGSGNDNSDTGDSSTGPNQTPWG